MTCDTIEPNKPLPILQRGQRGVYYPLYDKSKMNAEQIINEDRIVLMEFLHEFTFISSLQSYTFATDELSRGLRGMFVSHKFPVWLAFASTVFLDIHRVLCEKVTLGFIELQKTANCAIITLEKHLALSRGLRKPKAWKNMSEIRIKRISENIDRCVLNDVIYPKKIDGYKKNNAPPPPAWERFYSLARHPVFCSIQAFAILQEMQAARLALNNTGTTIFPAHLYDTLKQTANCASWPLTDDLIFLHDAERVFLGGTPTTYLDCYKQVILTASGSATHFARKRLGNEYNTF